MSKNHEIEFLGQENELEACTGGVYPSNEYNATATCPTWPTEVEVGLETANLVRFGITLFVPCHATGLGVNTESPYPPLNSWTGCLC